MGSDFHGMTVYPHIEVGKYQGETITKKDLELVLKTLFK